MLCQNTRKKVARQANEKKLKRNMELVKGGDLIGKCY